MEQILEQIRAHHFHPLSEGQSMTHDRDLGTPGIAHLDDQDWKVRLLAIRSLVLADSQEVPGIVQGLSDDDEHVRQVCAAALGIRREESAVPELERVAEKDPSSMVRSQAIMALGQMESDGSLPLLQKVAEGDSSRDVRHQCELAIDQVKKKMGASDDLREAFARLNETDFESLRVGDPAPDFVLDDTEGKSWRLSSFKGKNWVVLLWVFADWCPVCHGEFRELMEMREDFEKDGVQVFTLECHDRYRGRVMVGKELEPAYWFSKKSFKEAYTRGIWWPHLLDRAGAVGAIYGVDPLAFAVHAEYINRPSTVIVGPDGLVRFAYYGTYWGDRPSIHETLKMIQAGRFDYEHPERRKVGRPD